MANIKQQKKRILISERQHSENLRYRSTVKTLFNRLQANVDAGDKETAAKTHRELVVLLDRSVIRGAMPRNTSSRKKARASRLLLQEPKMDATAARKAKKKTAPLRKSKVANKAAADKPAAKKPAAKKPAAKKDEAPVADAPVEETPAAEAVVEETPAAEAKVAKTEAPAEETKTEDAPAEDAAKDEDAKA
ncbi:MAG: 30S ribosomal protein S20 [Gaiellales bacterium]